MPIRILIDKYLKSGKVAEFLRFVIVGIIATGIHYGLYLLFIHIFPGDETIWTNVAYSIGYLVSWFCNLWLTAHFTFQTSLSFRRGIGFAVCHLINFCLHLLFLNVFLRLGVPEKWAPIPVYCLVIPINFILVRTVFKKIQ